MESATSILFEIGKYTVKPIKRQVSYLFHLNTIFNDLRKAKEELVLIQAMVQERVERARMNTEVTEKNVHEWLTNVNQVVADMHTLGNKIEENKKSCNDQFPNWIGRYKLSKEATQMTMTMRKLHLEGNFTQVAHRAPTPGIEIFLSSDFEMFESRRLAFQQIMEALCDNNSYRIGVYGMGGVGKTTLVKEVFKKAKESNLFNDIVMATVSLTPDIGRIQGEIADQLNLKLDEESSSARANRICLRIKSVEKILIILDDVWKDVELEVIGIPYRDDHKGCKILLTTRSDHVCTLMDCGRKIPLNFLSEKESLGLIKKFACIVDDYPPLNDVVLKVVKECKGLPIAIVTVGKALARKPLTEWKVALKQLKESRLMDIEGVDEEKNVYVCLKWSYNRLKRKTRFCFLLCSLFPEDYDISIEELTRYVMGLDEFGTINCLEEVRNEVRVTINKLIDSCLLLESNRETHVKMHDMVRDVALWIASGGDNEFKLRVCTRLEKNENFDSMTAISLMTSNTEKLTSKLSCPRLKILLLGRNELGLSEVSETLFAEMNVLKVLSLRLKVLSPESFDSFTNLRSLYLSHCIFTNIYSLGKLKRLEILSLYHCRMDALPNELGELQNLRLLDLMRCECDQQKPIPPGLLQRLSLLEQLYIVKDNFKDWDDANRCNVNLSELSSLSRLIVLSLHLSMKRIPEGFVFPDLQRYDISINSFYGYHIFTGRQIPEYPNSRILRIIKFDASSPNAFKLLFSNVEYLLIDSCGMEYLIDITGGNHAVMFSNLVKLSLQNLSCLRTICQGPDHQLTFSNLTVLELNYCRLLTKLLSPVVAQSLRKLENLKLSNCNALKQIISKEDRMLLHSQNQHISLPKLRFLEIVGCNQLEYIFPITVAQSVPLLETLIMRKLPKLKQVFGHEDEGEVGDGNDVILSQLRWLILQDLPDFGSLYQGTCSSMWPSLEALKVVNCPEMKSSFAADLEANMRALGKKLKVLHVESGLCDLVLLLLTQGLLNLEDLGINNCEELEEMFKPEGFLSQGNHQEQLLLSRLTVSRCKRLRKLFTLTIAQSLKKLRFLNIDRCDELEHLITQDDQILPEAHLQH
ncbi:probable disease resistance protein At4g27220 [Quercus lobata]|uniref:probable disease resistance protein At4g27220 n=1 Tax=Quercus lobata TaxID=97700 RepID=UPI001248B023|nr:probable disease resistance protein At4g27220 [Quercus lobata]XP_030957457.1 probable disease resistance protein At4g27220 [Quercus lobata]XP_030957458.1 probable disease resistance protein At4g27220 [Quercus lobata]